MSNYNYAGNASCPSQQLGFNEVTPVSIYTPPKTPYFQCGDEATSVHRSCDVPNVSVQSRSNHEAAEETSTEPFKITTASQIVTTSSSVPLLPQPALVQPVPNFSGVCKSSFISPQSSNKNLVKKNLFGIGDSARKISDFSEGNDQCNNHFPQTSHSDNFIETNCEIEMSLLNEIDCSESAENRVNSKGITIVINSEAKHVSADIESYSHGPSNTTNEKAPKFSISKTNFSLQENKDKISNSKVPVVLVKRILIKDESVKKYFKLRRNDNNMKDTRNDKTTYKEHGTDNSMKDVIESNNKECKYENKFSDNQKSQKRKCNYEDNTKQDDGTTELISRTQKKKAKKFEKSKGSVEENVVKKCISSIENIISYIENNTDDISAETCSYSEDNDPSLLKEQLESLWCQIANVKALRSMHNISSELLMKLLRILEKIVKRGAEVSLVADLESDDDEHLWLELSMERILMATDASLMALHIMTSPNMPENVYLEDVIESVIFFTRFQLQNSIYPVIDPIFREINTRKTACKDSSLKGRTKVKSKQQRNILPLYNKLREIVNLLANLLTIKNLTDTAVLNISSMGLSSFFVDGVSDLQLASLNVVITIFRKYPSFRKYLLDDILSSIGKLPNSKGSLKNYKLNSGESIQMLTALILQLLHNIVNIPEDSLKPLRNIEKPERQIELESASLTASYDEEIFGKYDLITKTAGTFLFEFLNKCSIKKEESNYRPIFECFVQDLLTVVNKPDWPAANLVLSLLGKLLVQTFINKNIDVAFRGFSLDQMGIIAAKLRKDMASSDELTKSISELFSGIIEQITDNENEDMSKNKETKIALYSEEQRKWILQRTFLDYYVSDPSLLPMKQFCIVEWYTNISDKPQEMPTKNDNELVKRKGKKTKKANSKGNVASPLMVKKTYLIRKLKVTEDTRSKMETHIDYRNAELILKYLGLKSSFHENFDLYLKQILRVLPENFTTIRTKAMKSLALIVASDPDVLARTDVQTAVNFSFLDHSSSVREYAVDLVGNYVLNSQDLVCKYYDMISNRILDTGISVRKRVLKILKDICTKYPEFTKLPDICMKMIRRLNDEATVQALVIHAFEDMWFTPLSKDMEANSPLLLKKVKNIADVIGMCNDTELYYFEQLFRKLIKPLEDKTNFQSAKGKVSEGVLSACQEIIECFIENILRLEEGNHLNLKVSDDNSNNSKQLFGCILALHLFAKIKPELLVKHAVTIQPYLSLKCQMEIEYRIVSIVAYILKAVVPLMEHPSETFISQLEEDSIKLILQHNKDVVSSCLSCLSSVVNNITHNYKLVRDCFQKFYSCILRLKEDHKALSASENAPKIIPFIRRSIFVVGLLLQHFDFDHEAVRGDLSEDVKDHVVDTLLYFVQELDKESKVYALKAIGCISIRYKDLLVSAKLKSVYSYFLTQTDSHEDYCLCLEILKNIQTYLQEEERKMIRYNQEWANISKQEDLKEMGDVSSGMGSTVAQSFLTEILNCVLQRNKFIRLAACQVIQLILTQGLVHPMQIIPYLISMSTDTEQSIARSSQTQMEDIDRKYPGFIWMKAFLGLRISYELQAKIQTGSVVRGYVVESDTPKAVNNFLYSIMRKKKQQRRAFALHILKRIDDDRKTTLPEMLYLVDNLAHFSYQILDEPLFVIHYIDIVVSLSGTSILQSIQEQLLSKHAVNGSESTEDAERNEEEEEDDEDDSSEELLCKRLPEDTRLIEECISSSKKCVLLLKLREHLKSMYSITDSKVMDYSPVGTTKCYEKIITRRGDVCFSPNEIISKLDSSLQLESDNSSKTKYIAQQYLEFKRLMLKLDPRDELNSEQQDSSE